MYYTQKYSHVLKTNPLKSSPLTKVHADDFAGKITGIIRRQKQGAKCWHDGIYSLVKGERFIRSEGRPDSIIKQNTLS